MNSNSLDQLMRQELKKRRYTIENDLTNGIYSRVLMISKKDNLYVAKYPNPDEI